MKFLSGGKDFLKLGITQDPKGTYFHNGKNYYKPVYDDWDKVIPPSGYKRFTDGSHATVRYLNWGGKNHKQLAWDIYMPAWSVITSDLDWKIVYIHGTHKTSDGYVLIQHAKLTVCFVHCYTENLLNTTIKAGRPILKTNGTEGHAHVFAIDNNSSTDILAFLDKQQAPQDPQPDSEPAPNYKALLEASQLVVQERDQTIEALSGQIRDLNDANKAVNGINEELSGKLAQANGEIAKLESTVTDLSAQVLILQEQNKNVTVKVDGTEISIPLSDVNTVIKNLEDKITECEKTKTKLQERIDSLSAYSHDVQQWTVKQRFEFFMEGLLNKFSK